MKFKNLIIHDHPLIAEKLSRLRCKHTKPEHFRSLIKQISILMLYKISLNFSLKKIDIETPLEKTSGNILSDPITLIPILRAGIGMTDGLLSLIPDAKIGHIGIFRDKKTNVPIEYYSNLPKDISKSHVLLIDPMLATGGSACHAVKLLVEQGCKNIQILSLVAAPEGIKRINDSYSTISIHTASLDRELDEKSYIRPGLGDAGDRIFGTI